jgi:hypothetical protein
MVPENAQGSPRPRSHGCQGSVPVIEYLDKWLFSSDLIGRIDLKRGPRVQKTAPPWSIVALVRGYIYHKLPIRPRHAGCRSIPGLLS